MNDFAYFGTPYVARDTLRALVEEGYTPRVVISSPDAAKGRGLHLTPSDTKAWAQEHGLPVETPEVFDAAFLEALAGYGCQFAIVVAYGKILSQPLLDMFPRGVINVHYSLLPSYRGASPVETALRNGDACTGVTIQQMAYKLDSGNILAQRKVSIELTDTTLTLRPRLIATGAELLIEVLPSFMSGQLPGVPQDEDDVSYAPKIRKQEGQLDLSEDALANWNTYRALCESPGTYFFAEREGQRMRVKIASALYAEGEFRILRIVPEGKPEKDYSWLSQAGWRPVR